MSKTVFVTGANKGIGFGIAKYLGLSGWRVILGARDEKRANDAIAELKALNIDVAGWVKVELSDLDSIKSAANELNEKYPDLTLLVNNAGIPGNMAHKSWETEIKDIKETLGEKVADVKVSQRLKTSAVCLVADEMGPSLSMEQTFAEMDNPLFKAKRILELNPHHDLFGRLQKLHEAGKDSQDFKDYCDLLYTQALLIEGILPENPVDFANKVAKLMAK